MFDRSFNGASFDAHDGPVRCCRAVPRSNDCQTVAAHEASGGKSTARAAAAACEGVDENSAASACEGVDENARAWTKTRGNPECGNCLLVAVCGNCLTVVAPRHSVVAPHRAVMDIK